MVVVLKDRPKSVLHGKDSRAIDTLICVHCEVDEPRILDVTHNKGVMWKGSHNHPVKADINPDFPVDVVCDFTCMPYASDAFDVIVFDPPHLPASASSQKSSKIWYGRYGITEDNADKLRSGDNVSAMFAPFLLEAKRVLKEGGIVLAKIADIVHNHHYQWQHVDLIVQAQMLDMTPCDLLIKTSAGSGNMTSSKWKNIFHLRRSHSYWIVIRNASYDERKNRQKLCLGHNPTNDEEGLLHE